MKRIISLVLLLVCYIFLLIGCGNDNTTSATIDIASSVNFRCEIDGTNEDNPYTLGENDAVYLFQNCFDYKGKANKIKGSEVGVTTDFIKVFFVGDSVDNAPIKDDKADYGGFVIFSNNVVRFEYNGMTEYYQFSDGFYNFINTYLIIFADKG